MIVVYGATGFTGRLAAAELAADGAALTVVGRDAARVRVLADALGAQPAIADAADGWALRRAFDGADVVVSCAGPFTRIGMGVAEAAVEAGAHYVDCSGEPGFMRWAYGSLDAVARRADVTVVPAAGFDYVVGDLAASMLLSRLGPLRRIEYVYVTSSPPSAGTRRSVLEVLRYGGYAIRGGRTVRAVPAAETRRVALTSGRVDVALAPMGDPLCAQRRLGVDDASSWVAVGRLARRAFRLGGRALGGPLQGPLGGVADLAAWRSREGPTLEQRARSAFTVRVEAVGRRGGHASVELRGSDAYGLTGRALAWRARRLEAGDVRVRGALTPAEGADPLTLLRHLGLTATET